MSFGASVLIYILQVLEIFFFIFKNKILPYKKLKKIINELEKIFKI